MPQNPEKAETRDKCLLTMSLVISFFVSPLVFFTDLTRNPYYLQITLLNISLLSGGAVLMAAAIRRKGWNFPPNILYVPLAALLTVMALSFARAYFAHADFFRPSMVSEFTRAGMFMAVNCALVFMLAQKVPFDSEPQRKSMYGWLALILLWGGLWFLFQDLRTPAAGDSLISRFWDPYGGFLWLAGAAAAWYLVRYFNQEDFLHLAMAVGALASCYGILQYFRVELIWDKILTPYGNRSVSTFGNPNFISSYVVMLSPFAASYLIAARKASHRFFYGFVFLSYLAMLMSSLTRSSWVGAFIAFAFLFIFPVVRRKFSDNRNFLNSFFAAALILLILWPSQSLVPSGGFWYIGSGICFLFSLNSVRRQFFANKSFLLSLFAAIILVLVIWRPEPLKPSGGFWSIRSALFERVSEGSPKINSIDALSLSVRSEKVYSSFHQRLLIWTSAWQMGLESPMLGKGWGLFENFYPFYQVGLLLNFDSIRNLRTHANNAHNEILEMFSQTGLVGLGVYAWLFAVLCAAFLRYYRGYGPEERFWVLPFAAALLGMLADNMFNVSLHFAVPALLYWWLLGAFSKKLSGSREAGGVSWVKPAGGTAAACLLLLLCAGGVWCWSAQFMREMYYFRGFKNMRRNDFSGAAAELKKAYDSHGREVNNNYELANAYVRAGDLNAAKWAYGEALNSNAGYDEIYFNMAIVEKRLGEMDSALSHLKVSAFINPLSAATYNVMAEIYVKAGANSAKEAVEIFKPAGGIFPGDSAILNNLGYFYTLLKDYRSAKDTYGRGVRANPGDAMTAQNLIGVAAQLGLKNDPDVLWLRKYQEVQGRLTANDASVSARAAADTLIRLEPENINALALRARLSFKAGDIKNTKSDLLTILRAKPSDTGARYGLAVIYEKEGDFKSARNEWEMLLKAEPGNASAAGHLNNLPR